MYKIPAVVPFFKDELLQSWIFRLSEANGFDTPSAFMNAYFYPNADSYLYRNLLTDYRDDLFYFAKALPEDCLLPSQLLVHLTTFAGTAPFMSKEQRQRYLCQCAYKGTGLDKLFPRPHGTAGKIKVCPTCINEELDVIGEYYIHGAHQMPNVKVCWKHRTNLKYINYSNIKTLKVIPEMMDTGPEEETTDIEYIYALFCRDFLSAKFDFSTDTVADLIDTKLPGLGSFNERYQAFLDRYNACDPYFQKITKGMNLNIGGKSRIQRWRYVPSEKQLALLFLLYHTVYEIAAKLKPRKRENVTVFKMMIESHGYTLLGEYREDVVTLRHEDCGTVFVVSPYGFDVGWRCPHCSSKLSVQEQLDILVRNLGRGEYKTVTPFINMDKEVTFFHSICGMNFDAKPRAFIYEGQRCNCIRKYTLEEVSMLISENEGFELLKYNNANDFVTIGHTCGATFDIYFHKFLERPFCRVCERDSHLHDYNDEDFNREIQKVAGDEYELVGHYEGPRKRVKILHKPCGTVQDYKPFFFLDGSRCSKCSKNHASEEKFIEYVKETSHGRYTITGRPSRNLYEVTDTTTGRKQNLSRLRIIQEFTRPTPSPYLPMDNVKPKKVSEFLNRNELLDLKLKKMYPQGGLIFWDDVIEKLAELKEFGGTDGLYQSSQFLVSEHRLMKVAPKIYSFPGEVFTVNQVIIEKYVIRNGHHIGFYRGPQYAEEIGLLPPSVDVEDNKPRKVWNIATNMESAKTPQRKTTFMNCDIHIKGCPTPVTDDNWLILSALDFIVQYKQVVKTDEATMLEAVRNYIKASNNGRLLTYDEFRLFMNYKSGNIETMMNRLIKELTDE